jgi:hypothetical protein
LPLPLNPIPIVEYDGFALRMSVPRGAVCDAGAVCGHDGLLAGSICLLVFGDRRWISNASASTTIAYFGPEDHDDDHLPVLGRTVLRP